MRAIAIIFAAALLAGCAAVVERSDYAAERLADRVDAYCETTNPEDREALSERVLDATYPHRVEVHCDDD